MFQESYEALLRSYTISMQTGRLDSILQRWCIVLGEALASGGDVQAARDVLNRSMDGFRKLGQAGMAEYVEARLRALPTIGGCEAG